MKKVILSTCNVSLVQYLDGISNTRKNSTSTLAHRICAVRETFEESGILLTEPAPSPDVDLERWRHLVCVCIMHLEIVI